MPEFPTCRLLKSNPTEFLALTTEMSTFLALTGMCQLAHYQTLSHMPVYAVNTSQNGSVALGWLLPT
jgi:hypothetical protein